MTPVTTAPAEQRVTRWRSFEEAHSLGDPFLTTIARLTPGTVRRAATEPARRLRPRASVRVSVVIPCFNYGRFLADAVGSALQQAGVEVEIVIVDDRSTDDSRDVARGLCEGRPNVRLIENEVNSGHVRSFNTGFAASTGDYVVKLDADDLLAPGSLARAAALFEAYPDVGLVYGHPRHFSSPVPPAGRQSAVRWDVWRGRDWLEERCRLGVSAITNPEMVLRASLLRRYGPMNPAVTYAPDMEISLRIATVSDIGYLRGADQALHREHATSMSETDGGGVLVDLHARADAFRLALATADEETTERLDAMARRALARDALRFASAAQDRGRDPQLTEDLIGFAHTVWPPSDSWRAVRAIRARAAAPGGGRFGAGARRVRRRLRDESYHLRWMVFGI